jgi:lipopolysaccharide/colanic/teichoic acid biosynthesis glycosyltransferase
MSDHGRTRRAKRYFDLLCILLSLPLLVPGCALVALLVRVFLGAPVLFVQKRPGQGAQPFLMVKFRSMIDLRDAEGNQLPDEQRLTRFGRFLRATSLDELPELWNVLKGEMSLVGPRPLLMEYIDLYTSEQARRHEVPPGITGWAQVNGRNGLSWEDKFRLDVWYVDNQSLWLDLKILCLTVWKVISREGITAEGKATTSRFKGTGRFEGTGS